MCICSICMWSRPCLSVRLQEVSVTSGGSTVHVCTKIVIHVHVVCVELPNKVTQKLL